MARINKGFEPPKVQSPKTETPTKPDAFNKPNKTDSKSDNNDIQDPVGGNNKPGKNNGKSEVDNGKPGATNGKPNQDTTNNEKPSSSESKSDSKPGKDSASNSSCASKSSVFSKLSNVFDVLSSILSLASKSNSGKTTQTTQPHNAANEKADTQKSNMSVLDKMIELMKRMILMLMGIDPKQAGSNEKADSKSGTGILGALAAVMGAVMGAAAKGGAATNGTNAVQGTPAPAAQDAKPGESGYKMPSKDDKAPPGMSAQDIINSTPVLKNLGHQKDINRAGLKEQVGDWENDPDPKKRADAAWRIKKVLEHIDSSKNFEGGDRSNKVKGGVGDGNIEGITKSGDARHGTEAGNLKDFSEKGYSALKKDHTLDKTNDTHVKKDGSNKDNFQWAMGEAGKALAFIPIVGDTLKKIGDSEGGLLGVLKAGVEGVAEGVVDTIKKGKFTPWSFVGSMVAGGITQAATGGRTADPIEAITHAATGGKTSDPFSAIKGAVKGEKSSEIA